MEEFPSEPLGKSPDVFPEKYLEDFPKELAQGSYERNHAGTFG